MKDNGYIRIADRWDGDIKKPKNDTADKRRAKLDADVEAFLARGGKVEQIPQGATGDKAKLGRKLTVEESRRRLAVQHSHLYLRKKEVAR